MTLRGPSYHRAGLRSSLFFALAIVVPAAALLATGLHTLSQERQLEAQRRLDDRERLVREVEDRLVVTLSSIRFDATREPLHELAHLHPALVLVAELHPEGLLLPWDTLTARPGQIDHGYFGDRIAAGERAEFGRGGLAQALASYRAAGRTAGTPLQTGYAALLEARALRKLGRPADAALIYEQLLETDPAVRDEFGVPLSLYAAAALSDSAAHHARILSLLAVLLSEVGHLGATAALMAGSIAQATVIAPGTPPVDVAPRLRYLEAAEHLRSVVPSRIASVPSAAGVLRDTGWFAYGDDEVWLVAAWETAPTRGRALAVDAGILLEATIDLDDLGRSGLGAPVLTMRSDADGGRLLPRLPGLHVAFVPLEDAAPGARARARTRWFGAALALLMGLTLMGGYLLWRDVHREAELTRLRSEFVASVSHELKTPLTAIRMYAETLKLRGDNPELRREYVDTVLSESERLTRLLDNVLAFASMEQDTRQYHMVPAPLQDILADSVRMMSYIIRQQGFELQVHVDPHVPAASVDPDAIEQAVLNLLANAVKYSGESKRVVLRLEQDDRRAVITVTDFGLGIAPSEQDAIFEPFIRASTPATRRIPGTGLGLAVVRHVVETHGGHIAVDSELGRGSTFRIYLPLESRT